MIRRHITISKSHSFFLFGARATGKSSLLKELFPKEDFFWIDLLHPQTEEKYTLRPETLLEEIDAIEPTPEWIIIDEVQKSPALLNVVHHLIEDQNIKFGLTGSSARKLKRGAANLLAGRAFVYYLFPFLSQELEPTFNLDHALAWGKMPKLTSFSSNEEKKRYLESYSYTYLKEEVIAEQLVRNVNPFRRFLEVAAQSNGEILNYSKIASDVNADDKTVKTYFEILEDTLLGFTLPAYSGSVRKQISMAPKFYLFDTGVVRALNKSLHVELLKGSSDYGKYFESFIINEVYRLNHYHNNRYELSYIRSKEDKKIDLILKRKGEPTKLIEIKSTDLIEDRHLKPLNQLSTIIPNHETFCLCQEKTPRKKDGTLILPWREGLKRFFPSS